MAGKSPPQFKILNDTRDIVTLMTSREMPGSISANDWGNNL